MFSRRLFIGSVFSGAITNFLIQPQASATKKNLLHLSSTLQQAFNINRCFALSVLNGSGQAQLTLTERCLLSWWQLYLLSEKTSASIKPSHLITEHAAIYVNQACSTSGPDYAVSLIFGWKYFQETLCKDGFDTNWRQSIHLFLKETQDALAFYQDETRSRNGNVIRPAQLLIAMLGVLAALNILANNYSGTQLHRTCLKTAKMSRTLLPRLFTTYSIPGEWNQTGEQLFAEPGSLNGLMLFLFLQTEGKITLIEPQRLNWIASSVNPYYTSGKALNGLVPAQKDLVMIDLPGYVLGAFAMTVKESPEREQLCNRLAAFSLSSPLPALINRDQVEISQAAQDPNPVSAALFTALVLNTFTRDTVLLKKDPVKRV